MANAQISSVFQSDRTIFRVFGPPLGGPEPWFFYDRSGRVRQFAIGARLVHSQRELVCQDLGHLVDRDVVLGGELADDVAAQHLLELIGRNRQVLARSPRPPCSSLATMALSVPPWLPVPISSPSTVGSTAAPS